MGITEPRLGSGTVTSEAIINGWTNATTDQMIMENDAALFYDTKIETLRGPVLLSKRGQQIKFFGQLEKGDTVKLDDLGGRPPMVIKKLNKKKMTGVVNDGSVDYDIVFEKGLGWRMRDLMPLPEFNIDFHVYEAIGAAIANPHGIAEVTINEGNTDYAEYNVTYTTNTIGGRE